MTKTLYINELQDFYCRDIDKLTPGTRVIFGHVQPQGYDHEYADFTHSPYIHTGTVVEVKDLTANQLNNWKESDDWANEPKAIIFYSTEQYSDLNRYATDSGVLPYTPGTQAYNSTNFTVLVDELEAAGVEVIDSVSPEYQEYLNDYNSKVMKAPSWDY